ncbi:MAG: hypothetical protein M1832_001027 [Thelocarpon impressellum]|nr:MAG: hypothetical protein M1832_001027 [Thelocarpon impressellum]
MAAPVDNSATYGNKGPGYPQDQGVQQVAGQQQFAPEAYHHQQQQQQQQQQHQHQHQPQQQVAPQGYQQQPQPAYVDGTAPVVGPAAGKGPVNDWQNGFWDCFSPSDICCMAYWCPCILFGKTQERIKDPSLANYDTFNPNCMVWGALCACGGWQFIYHMIKRGEMRAHYNLDGSGAGDCLRPYCCPCCTIMQEEKEALLRNQGGVGATTTAQGYQKEGGMTYGGQPQA